MSFNEKKSREILFVKSVKEEIKKQKKIMEKRIYIASFLQLIFTSSSCFLLVISGIFLLFWKKSKINCKAPPLLYFHNLRSTIVLLLLLISTLEISRALLPSPSTSSSSSSPSGQSSSSSPTVTVLTSPRRNPGEGTIQNGINRNGMPPLNGVVRRRRIESDWVLRNLKLHRNLVSNTAEGEGVRGGKRNSQRILSTPASSRAQSTIPIFSTIGMKKIYCYSSPPFIISNSILAIVAVIILGSFHRLTEIRTLPNYLCLSITVEVLLAAFRIYNLVELLQDHFLTELEPFLQGCSGFLLFSLGFVDGFTIYKERFIPQRVKLRTKKESETKNIKIGYKHSVATFPSKMVFWWLTPLLWRGYKEPLESEDLGQLREEDSAKRYYDQFLFIYKTLSAGGKKKPSLWLCYLKSSWKMLTLGGILKLLGDLLALVGPLSIHQIVEFIEKQYSDNKHKIRQHQNRIHNLNNHQLDSNEMEQMCNNYTSIILKGYDGKLNGIGETLQNFISATSVSRESTGRSSLEITEAFPFDQDVKIYYHTWNELLSNGWIIAWIVLLASIAQGGLSQASTHLLNMTGIRIKTSLQGLIYRKTLLLSSSCIQKKNFESNNTSKRQNNDDDDGDGDNNAGADSRKRNSSKSVIIAKDVGSITNLMSEDTINIMSFFWIMHYVWAIPLKIGVVMYLLYLKLGISAVIGSFVCILTMTPLQFLIGKSMSKNSEEAAHCTDERLKQTNDIFLGIKLIKLNAWEKVFREKLLITRQRELKFLNKDSFYWTLMTFLTHVSSVLITFVTLAVYIRLESDNKLMNDSFNATIRSINQQADASLSYMSMNIGNSSFIPGYGAESAHNNSRVIRMLNVDGNVSNEENDDSGSRSDFTASRLFSALALFNQLTVPLLIFPITVPIIISAIVSTKRLQQFLEEPEVQKEFEGIRNMARILSKSDASLDMYEEDENGSRNKNELHNGSNMRTDKNNIKIKDSIKSKTKVNTQDDNNSQGINVNIFNKNSRSKTESIIKEESLKDIKMEKCKGKSLLEYSSEMIPNTVGFKNDEKTWEKFHQISKNKENLFRIKEKDSLKRNFHDNLSEEINSSKSNEVITNNKSITIDGKIKRKTAATGTTTASVSIAPSTNVGDNKKRKDLLRNSRIERVRNRQMKTLSRDSFQFQTLDNISVTIHEAVFSWDNCNMVLKIDNLQIPRGKLSIVVGKNGSGKSSFIAALLKEMQQISGEVIWNKYSTIAYVPQTPWLLNGSIRENILFGECFRPKRYEKVLEACALKPDIELMPEGDMTIIGERGINLSGGQKQRIVIARSLYSSANVVIMDDPFSALDNEVMKHVLENCIKNMLLKANRTVILVTQRHQLLYSSDYIIFMKDLSVYWTGSYCEIEKSNPEIVTELNSLMAKESEQHQLSPGKTARERWRLFKNVTRIGLQKIQNTDQDQQISSTQSIFMQNRRRSGIFGSRHLIYDIPLPIDECQNGEIIIRKRRSRIINSPEYSSSSGEKKSILRVNSLQPRSNISSERAPVVRNVSSPVSFQDTRNKSSDEIDTKSTSGFRQFLSRMSSRRSNNAVPVRMHRPISASNSIQSISEESHSAFKNSESPISSIYMDDESIQESIIDDNTGSAGGIATTAADGTVTVTNANHTDGENTNFIFDDKERKYGEIPKRIYLLYLKSCGFPIVFIFFISALIWQCLRIYTDVWLQTWTELKMGSYDITYYFNTYTIISSVCILMSLISIPSGQIGGCRARKIIYENLLTSILSKSFHFFQITSIGRIMNRFSNDMSIIDKKITATSQRLLQFTLLCLCAVLINISITPWFIVLTMPICAAYYIVQKFYRCSSRELQRLENMTSTPVIAHFTETVQGVTTIRAYSQESRFTELLFKRLEANTIAFIILNTSNRWLGIALDYLGGIIVFIAILTALTTVAIDTGRDVNDIMEREAQFNANGDDAGSVVDDTIKTSTYSHSYFPQQQQQLSASLVGLAINYTLLVPIYLNWVVKLLADIEMYVGSVERVAYYGDDNEGDDDQDGDVHFAGKSLGGSGVVSSPNRNCSGKIVKGTEKATAEVLYKPVPISWPQKGDINFENVSLRYPGRKQDVLSNISIKIISGEKIGICGRTGSGKSSLALSLFDVLELTEGRILIDDVDITTVHPDEIRSRLSIIPQDVHLFNATIRENLDPRKYYSDLDLWNCLQLAQLKEIVNAMPLGLDTMIAEGGNNFSLGERQLFCLARAILRGSFCLILDEATSSLDTATESALLSAAHSAFQNRTIISIAHRVSTLLNYDRIIVLDEGRIIEEGSPKELMSTPNGRFSKLLNSGNCP